MFDQDKKNNQAVRQLIGNVTWIYTHNDLGERERIVFRVNGILKGFRIRTEELGRVFDADRFGGGIASHRGWKDTVFDILDRKEILQSVFAFEVTEHVSIMTDAERKEWDAICQKDEAEKERRDAEHKRDEERREQAELKRLKEKYAKS